MFQTLREHYRDIELCPRISPWYCPEGHLMDCFWSKCPECVREGRKAVLQPPAVHRGKGKSCP